MNCNVPYGGQWYSEQSIIGPHKRSEATSDYVVREEFPAMLTFKPRPKWEGDSPANILEKNLHRPLVRGEPGVLDEQKAACLELSEWAVGPTEIKSQR